MDKLEEIIGHLEQQKQLTAKSDSPMKVIDLVIEAIEEIKSRLETIEQRNTPPSGGSGLRIDR